MPHDALVLLKKDHQQIRRLFRAYAGAEDTDERGAIVEQLTRLLLVHSFVEEELVYPRVRELAPDLAGPTLDAAEEHGLADVLVEQLTGLPATDDRFDAKARLLIELMTRHIDREEREWMPAVRRALGRKPLQELGADVLTARDQAPEPGPGNRVEQAISVLRGR